MEIISVAWLVDVLAMVETESTRQRKDCIVRMLVRVFFFVCMSGCLAVVGRPAQAGSTSMPAGWCLFKPVLMSRSCVCRMALLKIAFHILRTFYTGIYI